MSSSGTRVPDWLRYLCSTSERVHAALMRCGLPPGLEKAPCSRDRSWRIGWTLMISPPDEISTVWSTMATWT